MSIDDALIALGRDGLRFHEIGARLGMCAANAHYHWHRKATGEDRRARDAAVSAHRPRNCGGALGRVKLEPVEPALEAPHSDPFAGYSFPDHSRAKDEGRLGRIWRAEPFGFSLYGGTLV